MPAAGEAGAPGKAIAGRLGRLEDQLGPAGGKPRDCFRMVVCRLEVPHRFTNCRQDVRLDIADLYVFRGETGTAFAINLGHSIFGPIPVPGCHPEGMYEFKVDLDGDAVEDPTYRFTFDVRDAHGKQR